MENVPIKSRHLAIIFGYLIFLAILYGIKTADIGELLLLNANPFHLIDEPARQFLHGSILPIILGHYLNITSRPSILLFYGCILVCTWTLLLQMSYQRFQGQWPIFVLFITAWPLYHVNLEWVGKSDSLLLLGYLVLFFLTGPYKAIGALIVILSHKEMGMLVILFEVAYAIRDKTSLRFILAGAIFGLACHLLYLHNGLDQLPRGRLNFLLDALPNFYWPYIATHWYLYLIFLIGPIFLLLLSLGIIPDTISTVCIFTSLCCSMVTMDTSRTFVMVAIPAIFHLGTRAIDNGKLYFKKEVVWKLLIAQIFVFEIISPQIKEFGRSFSYLIRHHVL